MARREGVDRVVYLGGLGDEATSKHLRSRHRTAQTLAAEGPALTYFRAAMVVGAESESYRTLRYLVQRLPVMIAPAWLKTATQPIAIDDVVAYLCAAPDVPASAAREIQIGGPDVLSYGAMLDRMAAVMGIRAAAEDSRSADHPVAFGAVARARDAGRHERRAPAGRGLADRDRRHRLERRAAVRRRPGRLRRESAARARRGRAAVASAGRVRRVARAAAAIASRR